MFCIGESPENYDITCNFFRLSAQTVEEGHYVMGKQLDIPSEFSGVFKICCDYEREEIVLQVRYLSVS